MYKLLRLVHERCSEYDCTEYILVSVDLTEDQIFDAVMEAKDTVIKQTDSAGDPEPRNFYNLEAVTKAFPDIKDLDALQSIMKSATEQHQAWRKRRLENSRRFIEILSSYPGFVRLNLAEEPFVIEQYVAWGHAHGKSFRYGPEKTDTESW